MFEVLDLGGRGGDAGKTGGGDVEEEKAARPPPCSDMSTSPYPDPDPAMHRDEHWMGRWGPGRRDGGYISFLSSPRVSMSAQSSRPAWQE